MAAGKENLIDVTSPAPPPHWALLERELIRVASKACEEFFDYYFDERGYLLCFIRWGGLDGPDDALENVGGWPILHALGGPDRLMELYKKGLEGHMLQFSEANTYDVPFARDGMYYKEFPVMFDWAHNGEGFSALFHQGLSDPNDQRYRSRMKRFAGFYMDEDPKAPNYDPKHKIIRSVVNGSRGPLLRKSAPAEFGGDRVELEDRLWLARGERSYEDIEEHFEVHKDVVGDSPCNLATTVMAMNAYMFSGEQKYRDWILEYVDAWVERCEANGGLIPTNIGLDGTIGGECDGKWYGGVYGWSFTCYAPTLVHRPFFQDRAHLGFGNALLLTGDQKYVDVWRTVLDMVNENKKKIDGQMMYPHMYGDEGWYNFRPQPFSPGALEVYYWSMNPDDLKRLTDDRWIAFLQGNDSTYPVDALQNDLDQVRQKMDKMNKDTMAPDTRLSEDPNGINPAVIDALIQLTLGGVPTRRRGQPMHARLRYFDPEKRRAGLPDDVAALVEKLTADETVLTLVNINQIEGRKVVVQGGSFGEHQIENAKSNGTDISIDDSSFTVRLAPGAGGTITLKMKRYANSPSTNFPWP